MPSFHTLTVRYNINAHLWLSKSFNNTELRFINNNNNKSKKYVNHYRNHTFTSTLLAVFFFFFLSSTIHVFGWHSFSFFRYFIRIRMRVHTNLKKKLNQTITIILNVRIELYSLEGIITWNRDLTSIRNTLNACEISNAYFDYAPTFFWVDAFEVFQFWKINYLLAAFYFCTASFWCACVYSIGHGCMFISFRNKRDNWMCKKRLYAVEMR